MTCWHELILGVKQQRYLRVFSESHCHYRIVFVVFSCLPNLKIACLPVAFISIFVIPVTIHHNDWLTWAMWSNWYFWFFFDLNCCCCIVFIVFSCLPNLKIACLPVPFIAIFVIPITKCHNDRLTWAIWSNWYFWFFFDLNCCCCIVFIVFSCLPNLKIACLPVPFIAIFVIPVVRMM